MAMILAQRDGEWFLAAFAPHIRGCNLSTTTVPRNPVLFRLRQGTVYVQSNAPIEGIAFFPLLRYRGMRVHPERWGPPTDGQRLQVLVMYDQVSGRGEQAAAARVVELEQDGWLFNGDDGGRKLVLLEELERVEGPPPSLP